MAVRKRRESNTPDPTTDPIAGVVSEAIEELEDEEFNTEDEVIETNVTDVTDNGDVGDIDEGEEEETPLTPAVEEDSLTTNVPLVGDVKLVLEEIPPEKVSVQMVKVKPKEDRRFCVGGTWYNLKKGVITSVPVGVKKRLEKIDLLFPL